MEIVYAKKYEHGEASVKQRLEHASTGAVEHATKITIFKHADKVSISKSSLISRAAKRDSDKRFFLWKTLKTAGFRTTSAGNIYPFNCYRNHAMRDKTWRHRNAMNMFDVLSGVLMPMLMDTTTEPQNAREVTDRFAETVKSVFKINDAVDVYPLMREFDMTRPAGIPTSINAGFRGTDFEYLTVKAFGKSRATKDLIQAVSKSDPIYIGIASQYRGLVEDKMLVDFLDRHKDMSMETLVANSAFSSSLAQELNNLPNLRRMLIKGDRFDAFRTLKWGPVALKAFDSGKWNLPHKTQYTKSANWLDRHIISSAKPPLTVANARVANTPVLPF